MAHRNKKYFRFNPVYLTKVCAIKTTCLYLNMISLRNIPFFAVGVAALLFGALVFNDIYAIAWYVIALIYFIFGFIFRKPVNTSDGGH